MNAGSSKSTVRPLSVWVRQRFCRSLVVVADRLQRAHQWTCAARVDRVRPDPPSRLKGMHRPLMQADRSRTRADREQGFGQHRTVAVPVHQAVGQLCERFHRFVEISRDGGGVRGRELGVRPHGLDIVARSGVEHRLRDILHPKCGMEAAEVIKPCRCGNGFARCCSVTPAGQASRR